MLRFSWDFSCFGDFFPDSLFPPLGNTGSNFRLPSQPSPKPPSLSTTVLPLQIGSTSGEKSAAYSWQELPDLTGSGSCKVFNEHMQTLRYEGGGGGRVECSNHRRRGDDRGVHSASRQVF